MIVFLSGYPKSGKSVIAAKLVDLVSNVSLISPETYFSRHKLHEDSQREVAISAWEVSDDELHEAIDKTDNSHIIIYDTCGSNSDQIVEVSHHAADHARLFIYVFVQCSIDLCISRSSAKLSRELFLRYKEKFKAILPDIRNKCDKIVVIDNVKSQDEIDVNAIVGVIDAGRRIHKSQSISSPN